MVFNEEQGQKAIDQYLLLQMTAAEPPSAEELYEALRRCDGDLPGGQ